MNTMPIAIFMGVYYWFCRLRFGYTISSALLQPVSIAVFVGLITGEMALSMQIGAALQLVYLGVTSTPGGNVPSDPALAGCIAIPLGVMSHMSPEVAVALAVPFGVIGVFVDQLRRTTNAIWIHRADRYAEEANVRGIMRCAYLYPALMGFLIRFPFVFAIVLFGADAANSLLAVMPETLIHAFEVMGGILPALGFALTIQVIGRRELVPFFFVGYFAVAYLGLDVMAMAIFGVCIALIMRLVMFRKEGAAATRVPAAETEDMDVAEEHRILGTSDVTKAMWLYYFGCEESNSYERLQSLVFCASMAPSLEKLYPNKDDLSDALTRHLVFFNTEGTLGAIIQGIVLAMEEERAVTGDIPGEMITSIKTGLMGPIAGMGDGIIWAIVMPVLIGIFLPFANAGSAMGGIGFMLAWPACTIAISYYMIHRGYRLGRNSITGLLQDGSMQSIIFAANVLGLLMMGALSSSYINITTPLAFTMAAGNVIEVQAILDAVVPNVLPLAAVFGIYFYLEKRGPRYNAILVAIIAISVICAFLGIL